MSGKIVKVKLPADLHDSFRQWAFNARTTMQAELSDHVREVVGSSSPAKSNRKIVPGSTRMNSEVTGKSERDRQMEEIPPAKVNPSTLKEGHDWCKACGVAQVKLPGLLCKECAK